MTSNGSALASRGRECEEYRDIDLRLPSVDNYCMRLINSIHPSFSSICRLNHQQHINSHINSFKFCIFSNRYCKRTGNSFYCLFPKLFVKFNLVIFSYSLSLYSTLLPQLKSFMFILENLYIYL